MRNEFYSETRPHHPPGLQRWLWTDPGSPPFTTLDPLIMMILVCLQTICPEKLSFERACEHEVVWSFGAGFIKMARIFAYIRLGGTRPNWKFSNGIISRFLIDFYSLQIRPGGFLRKVLKKTYVEFHRLWFISSRMTLGTSGGQELTDLKGVLVYVHVLQYVNLTICMYSSSGKLLHQTFLKFQVSILAPFPANSIAHSGTASSLAHWIYDCLWTSMRLNYTHSAPSLKWY